MFDDVVQDVRGHVETVVSTKTGKLEERLSKLLSGCAKEASVMDEADAVKVLLAGIESRFLEEHAALIEATNEQKAPPKEQTSLLEALWSEVKTTSEKFDVYLFTP